MSALILSIAAWVHLVSTKRLQSLGRVALIALAMLTLSSVVAAATFLYYHLNPPPSPLAPWKDPELGNYGVLFFLAPLTMFLGLFTVGRGTPNWLFLLLELASIPLLLVGYIAIALF